MNGATVAAADARMQMDLRACFFMADARTAKQKLLEVGDSAISAGAAEKYDRSTRICEWIAHIGNEWQTGFGFGNEIQIAP